MTNTNLMRCGRDSLSPARAAARQFSRSLPELLGGGGRSGLIAAVGPWTACLRAGRRPAMEVYEHGELLDVVVESSLGGAGLRGARRGPTGRPGEGAAACAWGRLPPCGAPPPVHFLTGGLRRRPVGSATVRTAGRFWFASAAGEFRWARLSAAACCAEHAERGRAA
ncbi:MULTISPECIES: hypothetical protein [Kitasatospora]|uniref:Uncharacterized protein n=1 Tax=Kitasatospora setae (strain ATCC 33774 / DSM 43861 / JCM 3304 / KCC A-0304 / NBRC 14216 / KM-6054) TaxID=452652 RepID=E4NAW7_KITSK|nr:MULTISPECIES: hypothetical protein [Kitasatospora]BAJ28348.1 hypothetical protein KSE_25350 [Kitasatospora setae KM-6054]